MKDEASLNIKNTGSVTGTETIQLYMSKVNSAVLRPEKELKAFKKITLAPGRSSTVLLNIDVNSLAYFDDARSKWITEPGEYKIMAASSSKDIRQVATFNIQR